MNASCSRGDLCVPLLRSLVTPSAQLAAAACPKNGASSGCDHRPSRHPKVWATQRWMHYRFSMKPHHVNLIWYQHPCHMGSSIPCLLWNPMIQDLILSGLKAPPWIQPKPGRAKDYIHSDANVFSPALFQCHIQAFPSIALPWSWHTLAFHPKPPRPCPKQCAWSANDAVPGTALACSRSFLATRQIKLSLPLRIRSFSSAIRF